jgi:hypothetical protein
VGWIVALAAIAWPAVPVAERVGAARLSAVQLVWTAPDRSTYAVEVPVADMAAFLRALEAALAREREGLTETVAGLLRAGGGLALTRLLERVPAYIDWVYGWVDSYVAAFKVIGRGARACAWSQAEPSDADTAPLAALSDAMREVARAELDRLVVEPADPDAAMRPALERVGAAMAEEWRRVVERDQARWRTLLAAHGRSARRVEPTSVGDVAGCAAASSPTGVLALDAAALSATAAAAQEGLYAWRVTRPFATRLGALATRLAIGGLSWTGTSVAGVGGAATAVGAATSFAAASGVVWSIDYGLNRLDGALHRDALAGQVSVALATAMRERQEALVARATDGIGSAFADLAACADRLQA